MAVPMAGPVVGDSPKEELAAQQRLHVSPSPASIPTELLVQIAELAAAQLELSLGRAP